jgi:hypothetical protein
LYLFLLCKILLISGGRCLSTSTLNFLIKLITLGKNIPPLYSEMIAYVLFESVPETYVGTEEIRPPWTVELAREFCLRAHFDLIDAAEVDGVIVAKLRCATEHQCPSTFKWRIIQVSPSVRLVAEDERALDEFTVCRSLRDACFAASASAGDSDEPPFRGGDSPKGEYDEEPIRVPALRRTLSSAATPAAHAAAAADPSGGTSARTQAIAEQLLPVAFDALTVDATRSI